MGGGWVGGREGGSGVGGVGMSHATRVSLWVILFPSHTPGEQAVTLRGSLNDDFARAYGTLEDIAKTAAWEWARNDQNKGKLAAALETAKKELTPFLEQFLAMEPETFLKLKGGPITMSHELKTFIDNQKSYVSLKTRLSLMSDQHIVQLKLIEKEK